MLPIWGKLQFELKLTVYNLGRVSCRTTTFVFVLQDYRSFAMSSRTIADIEGEIEAYKRANPDWMGSEIKTAYLTQLLIEKNRTSAPSGTFFFEYDLKLNNHLRM